jgi:hypothetical protein
MDAEYDGFEVLQDRSVRWRFCLQGKQRALDTLKALGTRTFNECFATDLATREIIGRMNNRTIASQAIAEERSAISFIPEAYDVPCKANA